MIRKKAYTAVKIVISNIKLFVLKLFYPNALKYHPLQLIHPCTNIEIGKHSNLLIGKLVRIGKNCNIKVRNNAKVKLGYNVSFNDGCSIVAHDHIEIGNNTITGPNVFIYDHDHDFRAKEGLRALKYKTSPVIIGNNVWIGANVVILRGTKIGDNCVIGAGTVIKGEYPENSIIVQKRQTDTIIYNRGEKVDRSACVSDCTNLQYWKIFKRLH